LHLSLPRSDTEVLHSGVTTRRIGQCRPSLEQTPRRRASGPDIPIEYPSAASRANPTGATTAAARNIHRL
jgi:hypothetical protein